MFAFALVTLLLTSLASAHFTLNYPPTRGFDEDLEPDFCGNFPLAQNRTPFPLGPAYIDITSHHPSATICAVISFDQNPTSFSEFNVTSSGQSYGFLEPCFGISYEGEACFPVDVQNLGVSGVTNGTNATIQVYFNGGDGQLFQCADVVLLSNYTVPGGTECSNATQASTTAASSTASSSPSPTAAGSGALGSAPVVALGTLGLIGLVSALFAMSL